MGFERWLGGLTAALTGDARSPTGDTTDLERVTAVLLVEIARADHAIDDSERAVIQRALAAASSLSDDELDAVIDGALSEADSLVSLHAHVRHINDAFDKPGRIALIEQMWRVAMADGDIDRYEEYTIRKLSELLYLKHRDFMQAKLRVLEGSSSAKDAGRSNGTDNGTGNDT